MSPDVQKMPGLMWVDCNEQRPEKRWEATALARQHVMLRYLAKQGDGSGKPRGKHHLPTPPSEHEDLPDKSGARSRLETSGQQSDVAEAKHRARSGRQKTFTKAVVNSEQSVALRSTPSAALTLARDCEVYQAAWWHCYRPHAARHGDWIGSCRHAWNVGFWEFAKTDDTLREIFLSFAAAKEAAVRMSCGSAPDAVRLHSRAYLRHKGKAIQLVSKDIQGSYCTYETVEAMTNLTIAEGHAARTAVLATVCLLCKTAFVEGEYDVAESHLRAIAVLVAYRMHEIPSFLWLFAIWADLRLTGVSTRAPALPYGVHPDFADALLPVEIVDPAKLLATCNMLSLPIDNAIAERELLSLMQNLHEMSILFNDAADFGTDWTAPWNVIYDVAYALASLRSRLGAANGDNFRPLRLFLHAASIHFWSTTRKFVPFGGCHDYNLGQISRDLSQRNPNEISYTWRTAGGANNALLWSLANTCAAYLRQFLARGSTPRMMPAWLRQAITHVLKEMDITTYESFVVALRSLPFTENWTAAMAQPVYIWATSESERLHVVVQGQECALDSKEMSLFADLRLTFDNEIAVCSNSWLIVGPLDNHLILGEEETGNASTLKLPIRRNRNGHSFRCQLSSDPSIASPVPIAGGWTHVDTTSIEVSRR